MINKNFTKTKKNVSFQNILSSTTQMLNVKRFLCSLCTVSCVSMKEVRRQIMTKLLQVRGGHEKRVQNKSNMVDSPTTTMLNWRTITKRKQNRFCCLFFCVCTFDLSCFSFVWLFLYVCLDFHGLFFYFLVSFWGGKTMKLVIQGGGKNLDRTVGKEIILSKYTIEKCLANMCALKCSRLDNDRIITG